MFRTFAVRGLLILVLSLAGSAAAQVTWDVARDFGGTQNPNGQWTYGWKPAGASLTSTNLTPFPNYEPTLAAYPTRDAWQDLSRSNLLGAYHNIVGATGDIPTNMLLLQPDPLGELALVEWTAPANMFLHIQGMFQSLDTSTSAVTVLSNVTGTHFTANVNSTTTTSSFGLFLKVVAGEKIDFVASGGAAGLNVVISPLSLVGNASIQNISATDTRLRLTSPSMAGAAGGAWTFSKQRFGDGFDTTFLFQISQLTGGGADGFAFVIQNASTTVLGGGGGYLGYDGIPASLAVEFDTYQNTQTGWNDPNGNHISVHTLGINPNSAMETASIGWVKPSTNLKDGKWHLVNVHYAVQPTPQLSIYLDNVNTPVLQVAVDIVSKLQLADGTAWVGFTGGIGGYAEVHDIQNWHFLSYDLHPPILTLPANMTVEGNTVGGAKVTFTASALDAVDGSRPVTCTPASGDLFLVGKTTVNCSSTDLSGNIGKGSFTITVKDTTPPTITVPSSVTAPAVDQNGASVTYTATATDIVDGTIVPTCTPFSGSTFPLGTTTVTCTAKDHAGNSATPAYFQVTVKDETPPVINSLPTDLVLEATGQLTTVSWPPVTATDNVDGTALVLCTPASGSQFAVGSATVQCSATDKTGNSSSGSFVVTVRDTTPPTISNTPGNMILEATGPSGAVATWTLPAANDLVDGVVPVTCAPASGSTFPFGVTTVVCSAADKRNNKSTTSFTITVHDTILPAITCGHPDGLWHATDVVIACAASDSGSGLANKTDAAFVLTTSVPAGTETANAATNTHTVCDVVGNCATAGPITGNAVDKRSPNITIAAPANTTYLLHQAVAASYACTDGGSGVAACNGPVPNGALFDTLSAGAKQFTVNASDKVGNASSASVSYSVGYNLCLLSRIEPKESGSTIPLRLEVCDYAGKNSSSRVLDVFATGVVDANGAAMPFQAAGKANPGMRFRYIGGRNDGAYMFDLKTKGLSSGTYQLLVRVAGDPTPHAVTFQISRQQGKEGKTNH